VYGQQNNWYKISNSQSHWVSARYTDKVKRATVSATFLNVRSGAGINFPKVGSITKGEEVFISKEVNNWCQIIMEERWVSKDYLKF